MSTSSIHNPIGRRLTLGGLCALLLLVAAAGISSISRVTIGWDGSQTDGLSRHFQLAKNGCLISVMSDATNLVPDDTNGLRDVFVIDTKRDETLRVSVSSSGEQADGASNSGALADNGRYIAFHSEATNLVPDDTNGVNDVFVHDLKKRTTWRISVASDGTQADGGSAWPAISRSGRYVAFRSGATNLVPGDTNGVADVFVHDLNSGTTIRASLTTSGEEPNGDSIRHAMSNNGRYIAVLSTATNVVPGDTNGHADVFVHDLKTKKTTLVSVGHAGDMANGGNFQPVFSGNARYVGFGSYATNLVPGDTNAVTDVFVYDMKSGAMDRCSLNSFGQEGNGDCGVVALSSNGRLVYFDSLATNLVPDDLNDARDVFVHDRKTNTTERLSVSKDGAESNGDSLRPRIAKNGKIVAIFSSADNLVPGDTNGVADVFVIER